MNGNATNTLKRLSYQLGMRVLVRVVNATPEELGRSLAAIIIALGLVGIVVYMNRGPSYEVGKLPPSGGTVVVEDVRVDIDVMRVYDVGILSYTARVPGGIPQSDQVWEYTLPYTAVLGQVPGQPRLHIDFNGENILVGVEKRSD
jgi:hypothetical protein